MPSCCMREREYFLKGGGLIGTRTANTLIRYCIYYCMQIRLPHFSIFTFLKKGTWKVVARFILKKKRTKYRQFLWSRKVNFQTA